MAAKSSVVCVLFLSLSCSYVFAGTFPVPLLIWSSKSLDVNDEILAGHTFSYEDVQDKYLDKLKSPSKTLCVFLQDKLSIDDFAAYQSHNLKHLRQVLKTSATSIVLPSVTLNDEFKGSNRLLEYFEKNSHGNILPIDAKDDNEFPNMAKKLTKDELNIIVVHLPQAEIGEDSERSLAASDGTIGKILEEVSKYVPDYIGLLTAAMPRDEVMTGMEEVRKLSSSHIRHRRSADSDDGPGGIPCNETGILIVENELMLYVRDIVLHGNRNNSDSFKNGTSMVLNGTVEGGNRSVTLKFSPKEAAFVNGSSIKISLKFNRTGIRWSCVSLVLDGKVVEEESQVTYDCSFIDVPIDKSYVCQENTTFRSNLTNLTFQGLQVQPFGVKNGTFANSYDCIGFFTPPIWMGLLSVGVLVAILYGGMLSLLSIKSMDRFDNPKDPTIIIHNE